MNLYMTFICMDIKQKLGFCFNCLGNITEYDMREIQIFRDKKAKKMSSFRIDFRHLLE